MNILRLVFVYLFILIITTSLSAQPNFTANDFVPIYNAAFRFGTNPGYTPNWDKEDKMLLMSGSDEHNIRGIGANSLRGKLHESFLEEWGYTIRENSYNDYVKNGMNNFTVFLEEPSDAHRSKQKYNGKTSKLFANMYEPIWDNGENGTPVNDNNYMALYIYKTVSIYKSVKFWEIWNEPDFTYSSKSWQGTEVADSWWNVNPEPDELTNLNAPIQHYIRALRISYEVIKSIDKEMFVCLGGVGYNSFIDALLRNTDNPDDGKYSTEYTNYGGAYFDCVSYHSYPMYQLKEKFNSDNTVEILINSKKSKEEILLKHKYDDVTYPKKKFIITETNIPHTETNDYDGSYNAQRNYLIKAIIACQKNDIKSLHTYNLIDSKKKSEINNPYDAMGFYQSLDNVTAFNQVENQSAVGCNSVMKFLSGRRYDAEQTQKLNLPEDVEGAAFFYGPTKKYAYVLWGKTKYDSEYASEEYTFPSELGISSIEKYEWDYTKTNKSETLNSSSIKLSGSPYFILVNGDKNSINKFDTKQIKVYPNPSNGIFTIKECEDKILSAELINLNGQSLELKNETNTNNWKTTQNLPYGIYLLRISTSKQSFTTKVIIQK